MRSFSLDPRLRSLLLLWGTQIFVSALAPGPLFLAFGDATDSDLSSPGGLMLLEMIRLRQNELLPAAKETLVLLGVGSTILLFFRAHLGFAMVQATGDATKSTFSLKAALGYGGLWILGALFRCLLVLGGAWLTYGCFDTWEGGLRPEQVTRPALYALATLLSVLGVSVLTETAQLSLFLDTSEKTGNTRFTRFRRLLTKRSLALFGVRTAQGFTHLALLGVSLYFFILPQGMAATHPILCAVLNQIAVGATLGIEALWLHFAAIQFKKTSDASGALI